MTDERLDQILKQALSPEIDDSEIQIRRKVRNRKMKMKKIITSGLVACAALTLVVTGGYFGGHSKAGGDETVNVNEEHNALSDETADVKDGYSVAGHNLFVITAHAAELPEEVSSGDVVGLSAVVARVGSSEYLDGRFVISGQKLLLTNVISIRQYLFMKAMPNMRKLKMLQQAVKVKRMK